MASRGAQVIDWFKSQVRSQEQIGRGLTEAVLQGSASPYHYVKPFIQAASQIEEPPLAPTPCDVIYTRGKIRLLHYRPAVRRYKTPIFFVYSLINRYYILDFLPGRSLIEFMVNEGFDVYAIDWGTPGENEKRLTWHDYMTSLRYCLRWVKRVSKSDDVTLYGYCMGGTMSLAYTALYPEGIRNFVAQAVPVNFHDGGVFHRWTQPKFFNVDAMVDAYGNVPVDLMEAGFSAQAPIQRMTKWLEVFKRIDDKKFVTTFMGMEHWASDNIPFPGEVYRQYIKDCYQENNLYKGKMRIGGRRVDLASITANLLTIVAERDTIAPPCSSTVLNEMVASEDTEIFRFKAGHIGLSTSSKGPKLFWPQIADWIGARSDKMPAAELVDGEITHEISESDADSEALLDAFAQDLEQPAKEDDKGGVA